MSPEEREKLRDAFNEEARKYEQADFERMAKIAARVREDVEKPIDDKVFSHEVFKKAFDTLGQRRPPAPMQLDALLLSDVLKRPVHCNHCNDEFLVQAEDYGPGGCPTFVTCPAINEPWHVKR